MVHIIHDAYRYAMGKGVWKHHKFDPRGYVHLRIQVIGSKYEQAFLDFDESNALTFAQWVKKKKS